MTIREYDPGRDLEAVRRVWRECGWLEGDKTAAMDIALEAGRSLVAEHDGAVECLVIGVPGTMRYLHEDVPFHCVAGVTTSRIARRQGLAGRTTARLIADAAADGAAVSGLGMFEQGYYDRLGYGAGSYTLVHRFDPARLLLPAHIRPRPPRRLTADDSDAMHANRLARYKTHGTCSFHEPKVTRADAVWAKNGFGMGYFDGPDGALSHHFWCDAGGDELTGPYHMFWLAYQTRPQLLELLGLIHNLSDQVRMVHMHEPAGVQFQALLRAPMRTRAATRHTSSEQSTAAVAWWQMRICDVNTCLSKTKLPGSSDAVRFNLRLTDPIENYLENDSPWRGVAGSYMVTLGSSSGAESGESKDLPTLDATVNAFTRLWLGVRPATGLAVTDELRGSDELLEALDDALRLPSPDPDWPF